MKYLHFNYLGLVALIIGLAASLCFAESTTVKPVRDKFNVQTKNFTLNFEVGDDSAGFISAWSVRRMQTKNCSGQMKVTHRRVTVTFGNQHCKLSTPTATLRRHWFLTASRARTMTLAAN